MSKDPFYLGWYDDNKIPLSQKIAAARSSKKHGRQPNLGRGCPTDLAANNNTAETSHGK